jgi:C-methyltransferase-like protein
LCLPAARKESYEPAKDVYPCRHAVHSIPIVSEEEGRAKADVFLVLPYSFIDEFVRRESDWLEAGGEFIVPLPEFRVIRS